MIYQTKIGSLISNLKKLKSDEVRDIAIQQVIDSDFFKQKIGEQWEMGENKEGKAAGYYTAFTEEVASLENTLMPKIEGEPYNFMWSGNMWDAIDVYLTSDAVNIDTNATETRDSLFEIISQNNLISEAESIFGLNEENFKEFLRLVAVEIRHYVEILLSEN